MGRRSYATLAATAGILTPLLGGCGLFPGQLSERECMTRVMYFESNRSSEDGMLAVGTVVMNRIASGRYPQTVCGVVGQQNQFAPGALTSPMVPRLAARVARVADRVLDGERNDRVGGAMFFHTVGYTFPYTNMHYTAVAGGNAFYEKVQYARRSLPTSHFETVAPRTPTPDETEVAARMPAPRSIDDLLAHDTQS